MAKDADKLIRIFAALTSYQPVLGPGQPEQMTRLSSWAIAQCVTVPVPTLIGPPPPWPIGVTIRPDMQRVHDWLLQHPDQRDTDGYRARHDWLAEQLGLSPDTLEPLGSSSRAPRIEDNPSSASVPAISPPTEQAAESGPLAEAEAFDTASKKPKSKPAQPSVNKRVTCESWVADAVKNHPRPDGRENYAKYLRQFRPQDKNWDERTISNALAKQNLTHYREDPAHKATHKSAPTTHKSAPTTHKSAHEKPAKS